MMPHIGQKCLVLSTLFIDTFLYGRIPMAWNEPFETLVETIVDELGTFLMNRGDLAAYEVARTQEVCRDFCTFLCKDVHKATSQDYAVYLQMHALTPQDELDYSHMLADIRSYCEQTGGTQTQNHAAGSMAMRRKVKTNEIENSAEHASDMFAMENANAMNMHGSQSFDMRGSQAFDMRKASQMLDLQGLQGATPPKPIDAVPNNNLSERFHKFDFSVDDALADELNNATNLPLEQPNAIATLDPNAALFPNNSPAKEDELAFNFSVDQENETTPNTNYELNPNVDLAATEPKELMRGVKGVEYDFSHNSIRKMRDFEKQQRKHEMAVNNAIDYKLVGTFRSFIFERKFVIDTPLPNLENMTPYQPAFVTRYLIPLAPTLVLCALAIALSTIHVAIGAFFGLFAIIMCIFAIPNLKPANQSTPQATLLSYLNAKAGRCYGVASTLIAQPKDDKKELHFQAIWTPELQWHKAFLTRFKSQPIPEFRIPLGSETQNAIIILYNNEEDYWLVPMVRLDTKWYITDPSLGQHTIVKDS